jgi:DNA-binding transcriptional ArsR family regulator
LTLFSNFAKLLNVKQAAAVFKALSDPTRRQILLELKQNTLSAGELVALFEMTGPSVSRHLSILKNAELISEKKEGNRVLYSSESENLADCLNEFISQVCPTQINQRRQIKKKKENKKKKGQK